MFFLGNEQHISENTTLLWGKKVFAGAMPAPGALPQPNLSPLQSEIKFQGLTCSHSNELYDCFSDTCGWAAVCC